ncbi:P-loop containing nucleoside triphosphate hydrolase protein [Dendryphion nanum]|uniref:P-loop containing nucleoside triphosphate hydrolase protein n=1 Tax=Dendryphion nanum TaxID=256645 RepID=A0A9P9ILS6_9PLEO|nr:P-loop containing nucleoside triphosphate hydrolase protein [Dendryphion nanum]
MDFATPQTFVNARDEPNADDATRGQNLEIKFFEARYNSINTRIILSADARSVTALLLTRFYGRNKELEYTEMEVKSPYIRAALRAVIKKYPGLTFDAGRVLIRNEPRCVFHYREELRDYGMRLEDEIAAKHLIFFLNYMYNSFSREISSYYTFIESPAITPGIEHEFLWMPFKPGCLLFYTEQGIQKLSRLCSMVWNKHRGWGIEMEKLAYNGEEFGPVKMTVFIRWYDGYRPLQELNVYPLQFHPRQEEIYQSLIQRGRKYVALREISHRSYAGLIKGRIIVDFKKFGLAKPSHRIRISSTEHLKIYIDGEPIITDEEWCLFDSQVPGFSLSAKTWCFFELDRITEFEYNMRAFASLALPSDQKSLLSSLIRAHFEELQFDDLVKGKGKGLIILLHGEPGVGKTLTAESLSDYTKRPLYSISCGDLGTTAKQCEIALNEILDLATHWNAILLVDEADVFLEQRSLHDLVRNGCVAVFLRLLEYFEGIMFLTTNRIMNFDTAFKSRIHLAIKYPGLSTSLQRQLWTTFITNDSQQPKPDWLSTNLLDDLESNAMNGRQIKNVVRTAMALAIAGGRALNPNDISTSLKAMKDFERDFAQALQEVLKMDRRGKDLQRALETNIRNGQNTSAPNPCK